MCHRNSKLCVLPNCTLGIYCTIREAVAGSPQRKTKWQMLPALLESAAWPPRAAQAGPCRDGWPRQQSGKPSVSPLGWRSYPRAQGACNSTSRPGPCTRVCKTSLRRERCTGRLRLLGATWGPGLGQQQVIGRPLQPSSPARKRTTEGVKAGESEPRGHGEPAAECTGGGHVPGPRRAAGRICGRWRRGAAGCALHRCTFVLAVLSALHPPLSSTSGAPLRDGQVPPINARATRLCFACENCRK